MADSLFALSDGHPTETTEVDACRQAPDNGSPSALLIAKIRKVAEQTLGFSLIEDDDDLFDFGCDSILCLALLLEIERQTGRSLTPAELYDAPTIRGLAEAVQAKCKDRPSTLVLLKAGLSTLPPLILIPGLGSTVTQVRPLAEQLDLQNTIYGVEPYGLYADEQPYETIEAAARHIIDDISQLLSSDQSVNLLGVCYGGLLAFEICRQIHATSPGLRSFKPGALVLVNSYPHTRYWSLVDRTVTWFRVVRNLSPKAIVRAARSSSERAQSRNAWSTMRRLASGAMRLPTSIFALSAYSRSDETWPGASLPHSLPTGISRLKTAATKAFQAYAPDYLDAETLLITLPKAGRLPFDAACYWRKHISPLHVCLLSKEHADIFNVNLKPLAATVSRYLRDRAA